MKENNSTVFIQQIRIKGIFAVKKQNPWYINLIEADTAAIEFKAGVLDAEVAKAY